MNVQIEEKVEDLLELLKKKDNNWQLLVTIER